MEELIRLGAYRAGSSAEVDEAITLHKPSRPSWRKVRKKQRLWRTAMSGWNGSCGAKKHKTNVIAAQSA
jgi:hypothetical protein